MIVVSIYEPIFVNEYVTGYERDDDKKKKKKRAEIRLNNRCAYITLFFNVYRCSIQNEQKDKK